MAWIEGIGDEVVIAFSLFLVLAILLLAWKSTEVRETPASRLRFTITTLQTRPEAVASDTRRDESNSNQNAPVIPLVVRREDLIQNHPPPARPAEESSINASTSTEAARQPELIASLEVESAATPNQPVPEENEVPAGAEECALRRRNVTAAEEGPAVKLKLVYLDDTNRVVDTTLSQTLGDFKKQHFENELSANKVVKLIFNGQVLNGDTRSLGQLGLSDNCVVHCLIHQARNPPPAHPVSNPPVDEAPFFEEVPAPTDGGANQRQPNDALLGTVDIGGLLVPLFGLVLGLVWYCRLAHATHFTAAATVALVGLSGLFIVSLIAVYFPGAHEAVV